MEDNNQVKKRIAKNTIILYFRTFITMVVGLYTSRVILHALGETSFGVYSVVGGIVGMLAFLNGSLSGASSRFLTYAIGEGNREKLNATFSAALNLHILLALVIVIFGETAGLWFLYNKLVIPPEQLNAAFWILQFSIITSAVSITSVPFNASLISHENMSVFAYMGLYDAFSKLLIAYLISSFESDKLFFYGFLLMINSLITLIIFRIYAIRHYPECRFRLIKDKSAYKGMTGYSFWDMLGNLSTVCQGQGIDFLLNIFYGPLANTARTLATQILNGVTVFLGSFMTASRPRVIKYCAERNYNNMFRLTFITGKVAFFLVLALALPVMFEIRYIFNLWLGETVPEETYTFTIIIIITALMQTFHSAYLMTFHAIGRIKTGNLICGTLRIMALPISYIALKLGAPSYSVFVIILLVNVTCHAISWRIVYGYIKFDVGDLFRIVYLPCSIVTAVSIVAPTAIVLVMKDSLLRLVTLGVVTEIIFLTACYYLGFSKSERESFVNPMIHKVKDKILPKKTIKAI